MEQFFMKDYSGEPFRLFGLSHIIVLIIMILSNAILIRFGQQIPLHYRPVIRYALAGLLLVSIALWHVWNLATGQWNIQTMLPLHLCTLSIFLSVAMLITRSYFLYEFVYLLGISGASLAFITPGLDRYGFPHFMFFQFFISHGAIIVAGIFMTVVEGFRPFYKSLLRIFLIGNLYLLFVTIVNINIGSNYFFTLHKPETATLFDLFPPWPWYIPLMIILGGGLLMWLVYLPFAWQDWKSKLPNPKSNDVKTKTL